MTDRKELTSTYLQGLHKGFYNEDDIMEALRNIEYTDFFECTDDDEHPNGNANYLLRGSCHCFALTLNKLLGYNAYLIQGNDKKGLHAFCQIYKDKTLYYVDARGITSSFDEFMEVAREFVTDEYTIRPVTTEDIEKWKKDYSYHDDVLAFAEAVIEKHIECYTL